MIGSAALANRYFLLRHGESYANREGVIVSLPAHGLSAYGLTPRGHEQVATSVERARHDGTLPAVDLIVSSPFLRTVQSAEIAAGVFGVPIETDDRLSERAFGDLERTSDARYADVWARDRQDPSHGDWGVESTAAVLRRASDLIQHLEARGPDRAILLCTHGDVASILACGLLGQDLRCHREVAALGVGEVRRLLRGA